MKNFINLILATIIMPAYLIADESDEPASPPKAEEVEVKENESEEEVVESETEDDEDESFILPSLGTSDIARTLAFVLGYAALSEATGSDEDSDPEPTPSPAPTPAPTPALNRFRDQLSQNIRNLIVVIPRLVFRRRGMKNKVVRQVLSVIRTLSSMSLRKQFRLRTRCLCRSCQVHSNKTI